MGTYTGSDKRLKYLFENGGGGSANIWTGTMAEYIQQALQIADGTQVNITDDEIQSLIVSSYDVYSTEEKEVGVWIDGKPLYQKTKVIPFSNFTPIQGGTRYVCQYKEADEEVKNLEGYAYSTSYGYCFLGSKNYEADNTNTNYYWEFDNYYNNLNLTFIGNSASIINVSNVYITYQYTKTTDVAGSGIFVPSGSAAVHYSTTEQVIGTWVNGKPLYRKTFYIGNSVTLNAQYNVPHDLVNIDEIVNKSGTYYDDVDARQYPLPNLRVQYNEGVWIACFVPSNHTPILAIQTGGYRYGNISKISVTLDYTKTTD